MHQRRRGPSEVRRQVRATEVRFERVAIPDERTLWVCQVPLVGLMFTNTGPTELYVIGTDNDEVLTADNALKVPPGVTITWPASGALGANALYARSIGGAGQLSYPCDD